MSMYEDIHPEEFAEAAQAAITAAKGMSFSDMKQVLSEAGLFGVCVPEADGGLGLPIQFGAPICRAAGAHSLRFPLIEQMLVASALSGSPEAEELLAGSRVSTIAWQSNPSTKVADHSSFSDVCDWILILEDEVGLLIDSKTAEIEADESLNPEAPRFSVNYCEAKVIATISHNRLRELKKNALVLTASYLHGAGSEAIRYTQEYLSSRVQFGRPLTAKQAVRHHLARMKLLNEVSIASIDRSMEVNEFDAPRTAESAWAVTANNTLFIIEKAIHLNGGMGFTWEVPLHYALRDARKLHSALSGTALLQQVGRSFINAA